MFFSSWHSSLRVLVVGLLAYLALIAVLRVSGKRTLAKLKALLRKAAARTVDELWAAVASAIDTFPPTKCNNYFAAAGYDAW